MKLLLNQKSGSALRLFRFSGTIDMYCVPCNGLQIRAAPLSFDDKDSAHLSNQFPHYKYAGIFSCFPIKFILCLTSQGPFVNPRDTLKNPSDGRSDEHYTLIRKIRATSWSVPGKTTGSGSGHTVYILFPDFTLPHLNEWFSKLLSSAQKKPLYPLTHDASGIRAMPSLLLLGSVAGGRNLLPRMNLPAPASRCRVFIAP